jgi:hypothetical protein
MGASVAMAAAKPLPVEGGLRFEVFFFFLFPPLPMKRIVDDDVCLSFILFHSSVAVKDGTGKETSRDLEPDGWKAAANGNIKL